MSFLRLSLQKIVYQFVILLLFYAAFRALFILINYNEIAQIERLSLLEVFVAGIRFDISAIAYLNALWMVFTIILPLNTKSRWIKIGMNVLFFLPNIVGFLFEISDWVYFNYIRKRSTFDVFDLVFSKGDFLNLLPSYLQQFWIVPLIAIIVIFLLVWSHLKLNRYFAQRAALFQTLGFKNELWRQFIWKPIVLILVAVPIVIGMRGGLQLIPINPRNAVEYVAPEQASVVLNTPFSIMTTAESSRLFPFHFMSEEEADAIVKPIKKYHDNPNWKKKNIVFVIWESFSRRYASIGGLNSVTPFFDSLANHSYVFIDAYANALRSNEGVPSIFSGFPAMMDGPIVTSMYSNNLFTSFPQLLQMAGYSTVFYHGGNNGTMSLDTYAKNAGFKKYIGRTEFGIDKEYDGTWGVWDVPFFQFVAADMDKLKEPFLAAAFTLTSHAPYNVPKGYKPRSANAKSEIEITMDYTDFALQQFFHQLKNKPWFSNTIFVITADHGSSISEDLFYTDGLGRWQIPFLIYDPSNPNFKGKDSTLLQQLDFSPSLLDYLGYDQAFFSLGNSAFDTSATRFVFSYLSGNFNVIKDGFYYKSIADKFNLAFKYPSDQRGLNDLGVTQLQEHTALSTQRYTQAFVQLLFNGMIKDELNIKTYAKGRKKP